MSGLDAFTLADFRIDFLRAAIRLLNEQRIAARDLLALLLHSEDRTYEEIAEVLECGTSTVERMIDRCSQAIADSELLGGY